MATSNNDKPQKSPWRRRIVWFAAFVIAFVAVKSYKQHAADSEAIAQGTEKATASMQQLQSQAAQQHPDQPLGVATSNAAAAQGQARLASESGAQKADEAAGQFLGYYLANVRARFDYCKSQGVDISTFVSAFKQHNATLYEKSRVINARGPYSADVLEDTMYKQMGPTMEQMIRKNTEDLATRSNTTAAALCQALAASPVEAVNQLDLSQINPPLYQALSEAQ
ncbi:hypothetical protein WJ542_11280 [Paraburkholderia sp. B3]|uniref:hypothetical protein n=1 Tax=Paraburkholderia sp. B3 TaxID=3134791 RepID=UPI0039822271